MTLRAMLDMTHSEQGDAVLERVAELVREDEGGGAWFVSMFHRAAHELMEGHGSALDVERRMYIWTAGLAMSSMSRVLRHIPGWPERFAGCTDWYEAAEEDDVLGVLAAAMVKKNVPGNGGRPSGKAWYEDGWWYGAVRFGREHAPLPGRWRDGASCYEAVRKAFDRVNKVGGFEGLVRRAA